MELFQCDKTYVNKTKLNWKSSVLHLLSCCLCFCPIQSQADTHATPAENQIAENDENAIGDLDARCGRRARSRGPTGPTGATGAIGLPGPTGPTGLAGSSAIIPFSSGIPVVLSSVAGGGVATTGSAVGFGSSSTPLSILGGVITLQGGAGINLDHSFSMPTDGTITSISAYFSAIAAVNVDLAPVTITAQLYSSPTPNNDFTAIPGAVVTLTPNIPGTINLFEIADGITTGLAIPVTAQTRLLFVFTSSSGSVTEVTGYASGGVAIVSP